MDLHFRGSNHRGRLNSREILQKLFQRFTSLALARACEKAYGAWLARCIQQKFNAAAVNLQKFRASLHSIRFSSPTSVTDTELNSVTIAKPLEMSEGMSCDFQDYPRQEWRNDLAMRTLRSHPKFSYSVIITLNTLSTSFRTLPWAEETFFLLPLLPN